MFREHYDQGYQSPAEGIWVKALTYDEKTMLVEFRMDAGAALPPHQHPHEQSGYLVSGHIKLTIGDEAFDARPGDGWTIPGDVPHKARIIEDSVAVEVFSPPREEYLA